MKTKEEIIKIVKNLKGEGKTVVGCSGAFDILHVGHIKYLREAKAQGDVLIVFLNSDSSIKSYKSEDRPLNNENDRAEVLSALSIVDYVVVFNEDNPVELLKEIHVDVYCNGEEYGENCVEAETVKSNGGKIHLIKRFGDYSTTAIIEKSK
ncbi:adenylyltransferase/cytidyltransferase family protein [Nanoarchaeota archaeon]